MTTPQPQLRIRQGSVWVFTDPETGLREPHHVTSASETQIITWNEPTIERYGPGTAAWRGSPADFLRNFKPAQ